MATAYQLLPPVDQTEIARDLRALGLRAGDTVLVHSAMSRIGNVRGAAGAVVDAFRDVLGVALEHLAADPCFLRLREGA